MSNPPVVYPATPRGRTLFAAHWLMWKIGKALYRPAIRRAALAGGASGAEGAGE